MANITQRGATGPLPFRAGGQYQSANALTSTPGAYGTSVYTDVAQLVGTRWDLNDGREVILVSTEASTQASPGLLYQDSPLKASYANLAVSAFTAYSTISNVEAQVTVTLVNGGSVTANQYAGGYAVINDGGQSIGQGQTLRIASHLANSTSGGNLVLNLEESPNTALTTSSKVTLLAPHGSAVVVQPTTPTNVPVGIALYPIPAGQFGFLTAKGLCSARCDATVAGVGLGIAPSQTTAGDITASFATSANIGTAAYTAISAKSYPVFLNL